MRTTFTAETKDLNHSAGSDQGEGVPASAQAEHDLAKEALLSDNAPKKSLWGSPLVLGAAATALVGIVITIIVLATRKGVSPSLVSTEPGLNSDFANRDFDSVKEAEESIEPIDTTPATLPATTDTTKPKSWVKQAASSIADNFSLTKAIGLAVLGNAYLNHGSNPAPAADNNDGPADSLVVPQDEPVDAIADLRNDIVVPETLEPVTSATSPMPYVMGAAVAGGLAFYNRAWFTEKYQDFWRWYSDGDDQPRGELPPRAARRGVDLDQVDDVIDAALAQDVGVAQQPVEPLLQSRPRPRPRHATHEQPHVHNDVSDEPIQMPIHDPIVPAEPIELPIQYPHMPPQMELPPVWPCAQCTFENAGNNTTCAVCNTARDADAPAAQPMVPAINPNHGMTAIQEEPSESNDGVAVIQQPAVPQQPPVAPSHLQPAQWNCPGCTFTNVSANGRCAMCHTGRNGEAPPQLVPPNQTLQNVSSSSDSPAQVPGDQAAIQPVINGPGDDEPASDVTRTVRRECQLCYSHNYDESTADSPDGDYVADIEFCPVTDDDACRFCGTADCAGRSAYYCKPCMAVAINTQLTNFDPIIRCICRDSENQRVQMLEAPMNRLCAEGIFAIPADGTPADGQNYKPPRDIDLTAALAPYNEFKMYNVASAFDDDWRFCPSPGCVHRIFGVAMGSIVTTNNHRTTCEQCGVEYCCHPIHQALFQKKGVLHDAQTDCENVQVSDPEFHAYVQRLLRDGDEQPGDTILCPSGCGNPITKKGGCFQMVCGRNSDGDHRSDNEIPGCGHVFCFYCREAWSSVSHDYYSCPRFNGVRY